jgi:hypothetical protein
MSDIHSSRGTDYVKLITTLLPKDLVEELHNFPRGKGLHEADQIDHLHWLNEPNPLERRKHIVFLRTLEADKVRRWRAMGNCLSASERSVENRIGYAKRRLKAWKAHQAKEAQRGAGAGQVSSRGGSRPSTRRDA